MHKDGNTKRPPPSTPVAIKKSSTASIDPPSRALLEPQSSLYRPAVSAGAVALLTPLAITVQLVPKQGSYAAQEAPSSE